jgi:hypothetical protein
MTARVNPYSPGVGSSPPVLAGRGRQLSQIAYLADQLEARAGAENIVWSGLRGMGKTVLLHEALDRLRDRGWLAGYSEVRKNAGIGSSVASILLQGQAVLGRGKLAKALGWLREMAHATTVTAGTGDFSVQLGLVPAKGTQLPEDALDSLFIRLGEAAADAGVGAMFLLDELQLMDTHDLSALLHAANAAEGLPVGFVATGLPDLPGLVAAAGSYAERLFYDRVDRLSRLDVTVAIEEPAATFDVGYQPEAIDALVGLVEGYPYFAQLYAMETWRSAGTPSDRPGTIITLADVEDAIEPTRDRLEEGLYRIRYDKASEREQGYLGAMAVLGDGRIPSGDVARQLGSTPQAASTFRDRLMSKGIIYSPAHNVLEFSVPGFAAYVRRRQGTGGSTAT